MFRTLYYLTSIYLRRLGAFFIFFCIFLIQNTNKSNKFLVPLPGTIKSLVTLLTTCKTSIKFLALLPGTNKFLVLRQKR